MMIKIGFTRKVGTFLFLLSFCGLSLVACGTVSGTTAGTTPTPAQTAASTPTSVTTPPSATNPSASFMVTGVDMAVNPPSLSGITCGQTLTVTYTATFHFPANNPGGQAMFEYTTNNGRGTTIAGLIIPPGQTSATYQFTWSGQVPADHTAPGLGGVIVTHPNTLTSQMVKPAGTCSTGSPSAFKVTSIELSASPLSAGIHCGTNYTEHYNAIFHIAPGGPGGTITFTYTTNNGRSGSSPIHLNVAAGQTSISYTFTWSGTLPADHTAPGTGIVLMTAPNQGESPSATPSGMCS